MRVALLLLLAVALAAASAVTLDGQRVEADRAELTPTHVRLGATVLALADVDTLVLGAAAPAVPDRALMVRLTDGSWLPAHELGAATAPDRLAIRSVLGPVELPLSAVSGWGEPQPPAGGGDAVLVETGVVEGRILGLRDGALRLLTTLDPEPIAVPMTAIRGARLANPAPAMAALRLLVPIGAGRTLALVPTADGPALAAAPAVRIDPTALGALTLRVDGGRRVYLSDLTPSQVREDGMFGVVWPHARDRAIGGGPLRLDGTAYAKGLVVHSVATLAWDLGGSYRRLRARVGISDAVAPEGDCLAIVRGDGRELWRSRVRGGEPPRTLDLDLAGITRLELVVEAGERYDIGDHLTLADAQLIRR